MGQHSHAGSMFPTRSTRRSPDPALPSYVRDWFAHREPGEYWTSLDISTRLDRIRIPALHIAGWFDTYLEGSIAGYLALRNHAGSEFARENQYLIAGPWVHIPWGDRVGDLQSSAKPPISTPMKFFCAGSITGSRTPGEFQRASRAFATFHSARMNGAAQNEWPPRRVSALSAQPRKCQLAQRRRNSRSQIPPGADEPRDVFVYDPEVPVLRPAARKAERSIRSGGAGDGQQPARLHVGAGGARDGNLRPSAHQAFAAHRRHTRTSPPRSCA
jgi:predicted acyl esterase